MAQTRHVVYKTNHLKDRISWTSGLAGVIRLLTWETDNALGISKTQMQKRSLEHVFETCHDEVLTKEKFDKIASQFETKTRQEIQSSSVENLYDHPIKGSLVSPIEAQRRLRLFSEEFLNKEFDVFMSLLPNHIMSEYLNSHFTIPLESQWSIIGSSNDFEASTGMKFMYMDTLAYSHNTSTLVALELKMDSDLGKDQILKYCFMAAYLEQQGMIARNSIFNILILGNDSSLTNSITSLKQEAKKQLQDKQYPKKGITPESIEALAERACELLDALEMKNTTWQDFGAYFEKLSHEVHENPFAETLHKLIDGFLVSLQTKYSRKKRDFIYRNTQIRR